MQPITIMPQDVTDQMFLSQYIGEGEYNGQPFTILLNTQSGDWVIKANGKRYALPLTKATKQLVEQMFEQTHETNEGDCNDVTTD